mgnify:CR=1 FL=1
MGKKTITPVDVIKKIIISARNDILFLVLVMVDKLHNFVQIKSYVNISQNKNI